MTLLVSYRKMCPSCEKCFIPFEDCRSYPRNVENGYQRMKVNVDLILLWKRWCFLELCW